MSITARNRDFTSPPTTQSMSMLWAWSDAAVNGAAASGVTGLWRAVAVDGSGYLKTVAQPSAATYQTFVTGTTGGQITIPVGAYDWSLVVQSGTAFLNGFPIFASNQTPMFGGNIGIGSTLSTPLNVGVTGGRILVTYDF